MNVAPDQTIILGLEIFLDHKSLSLIDQKILVALDALKSCWVIFFMRGHLQCYMWGWMNGWMGGMGLDGYHRS